MQSNTTSCEVCPMCRSRAYEVERSRYIGAGELTIGYLVRVRSCSLCKREWEDATLAEINAFRENGARRAYWDAANPPGHAARAIHANRPVSPIEVWLDPTG